MKLSKIKVNNFKNLGKEYILPIRPEQNFEFLAENKFGKTSIADAINWVLTGKLYNGSADIMGIKPTHDSRALVSVELEFDSGDVIGKTYQENWVRTRGTQEERLEGHVTKCYLNGENIPVTKFDDSLYELFGVKFDGKWKGNLIQLLLDPLFFGMKMEWQDRRKLVIDLVGDVTDDYVLIKDKTLEPLRKYLAQYKGRFDGVKKLISANLKENKIKEEKLKAQIEVLSADRTITEQVRATTVLQLAEINRKIMDTRNKKYQGEKDLIAEKNNQLAELRNQLADRKEKDLEAHARKNIRSEVNRAYLRIEKTKISEERIELEKKLGDFRRQYRAKDEAIKSLEDRIKENEAMQERLRTVWEYEKEKTFQASDSFICPECGYDLNGELVENRRKEYNENKVKRLEEITGKGKGLTEKINEYNEQIKGWKSENESLSEKIAENEKIYAELGKKVDEINVKGQELTANISEQQPSEEALKLEKEIIELMNKPIEAPDTTALDKEIADLEAQKPALKSKIETYKIEKANAEKAKMLQTELEAVLLDVAEYESLQDMLTTFMKMKLELLTANVESVFGDIKFQLVESNLKEGSWNEVCWVLDDTVPYHNTNSAAKITLGIRVCEAIRKRLGIEGLPYIIDNGERITDRNFKKYTHEQTISFVAYNPDNLSQGIAQYVQRPEPIQSNLFSNEHQERR